MARAIASLPLSEQAVIRLYYFEGANQEEIAVLLSRTRGAVAGLLSRANRRLKKNLGFMIDDFMIDD